MGQNALLIAKTSDHKPLTLLSNMANRHGLITGATGTGKTVTLQKLAESFSEIGVPVFMADVKGDLSGIAIAGTLSEKLQKRLEILHINDWQPKAMPSIFWDVFGEKGHPIHATISDVGPLLLSRLLGLNDVQTNVLQIIFKIAKDNNLLLIDLKDLNAVINYVNNHIADFKRQYGNITTASIGSIQRGLFVLEEQGCSQFLAEPVLDINDLLNVNHQGQGVINILAAQDLYNVPILYSTLLLWLLSKLYENLPEQGDRDKPKLVFFFDEAHLLFSNTNKALVEKIELIVRLIRSKGVGVYFVTQNPLDIPDRVRSQLGNRIQHALHAFSPNDQKAIKAAAQTMRTNPQLNTEQAITQLAVGEALISFLDQDGSPQPVEKATIIAPYSRMGTLSAHELAQIIQTSPLQGKYETIIDKVSAFEKLKQGITTLDHEKKENNESMKDTTRNEQNISFWGRFKDFLFGKTGPRGGYQEGFIEKSSKKATKQLLNKFMRSLLDKIKK